ncbi:MAG: GNAT family N-acetyltransferase [Verrucomicrobiota bacterium]
MPATIRPATPSDTAEVSAILIEAAQWLAHTGRLMWRDNELAPERIAADVADGLFVIAEWDGVAAGTMKYQLEDPLFWPDVPSGEAGYMHRLAVRRQFAGGGVSHDLFAWALWITIELNRRYLRLDCEASRPKLRAIYERFGFKHHSDRQVGPYFVARYQLDLAED